MLELKDQTHMEVETTAGQATLWGNLLERKLWRMGLLLNQKLTSNIFRSQLEFKGVCFVFVKGEALNAYS